MNPREQGFLLLTSQLGDPDRKPLTVAQFRTLAQRVQGAEMLDQDRQLETSDLIKLGYGKQMAEHIVCLLSHTQLLAYYEKKGQQHGCVPITRVSNGYPVILRQRLGLDSPGCFWAKGDTAILDYPGISLVGSRELAEENRLFAGEVGRQAARNGLTLISGNARGADRVAQEACLEAGGRVVSIVADNLSEHTSRENVLYLSQDGYDDVFSAHRALSRNRSIHALGRMVFVAQATLGKGGTWDGTVRNLKQGWSHVACFRDGSDASRELEQMGAFLVDLADLRDFDFIPPTEYTLI